jgi:hypothetical protein
MRSWRGWSPYTGQNINVVMVRLKPVMERLEPDTDPYIHEVVESLEPDTGVYP